MQRINVSRLTCQLS